MNVPISEGAHNPRYRRARYLLVLAILWLSSLVMAAYKARTWNIRSADSYPSRLTSEGVTIAVDPLFQDRLAAQVFDKNDMITRGIMPVGVIIFNDNDFPIIVESASVQLINGDERIRTMEPQEVVYRLFAKGSKAVWIPQPIPRLPGRDKSNADAFEDFDQKFLGRKIVAPRQKGGGFLYLHIPATKDIRGFLSKSRLYLPEISRYDTGTSMIFFEVELQAAVDAIPGS